MCTSFYKKYESVLIKIGKRFKSLQKICRVIALLDAILALLVLLVLIIRRAPAVHSSEPRTFAHISDLVIKVAEIVFALILFEGVRKKIYWMVKLWLLFCFVKILYSIAIIVKVAATGAKFLLWSISFEVAYLFFNIIQAVFILAFQTKEKSNNEETVVYHQDNDNAVYRVDNDNSVDQVDNDNFRKTIIVHPIT